MNGTLGVGSVSAKLAKHRVADTDIGFGGHGIGFVERKVANVRLAGFVATKRHIVAYIRRHAIASEHVGVGTLEPTYCVSEDARHYLSLPQ